jgi:hypothetical protein
LHRAGVDFRRRAGALVKLPHPKKDMNRNGVIVVIGATLALALVAIAAEQKTTESKKSAGNAAAQHVMLTPADLEWGEVPPGLPA